MTTSVKMVRVYLTEAEAKLPELMAYLHDESKVRGVTVFRGITGFGRSGAMHSATLIDMSMDLPIVVEFFDEPDKIDKMLAKLNQLVDPGHIVAWSAEMTD
jgi:PII-like signaling protein